MGLLARLDRFVHWTRLDIFTAYAGRRPRNLRWLRAAVPADTRSSILEIARKGVRSLFPATRDACFAFLVDMADELSPSQRDRLPAWLESGRVADERASGKAQLDKATRG